LIIFQITDDRSQMTACDELGRVEKRDILLLVICPLFSVLCPLRIP